MASGKVWIGLLALAGGLSACGGVAAPSTGSGIVVVAAAASASITPLAMPPVWPGPDPVTLRDTLLQRAADDAATDAYPDLPLDQLETATDAVLGDGQD